MAVKRLLRILLVMGLAWGLLSEPGLASGLKPGSLWLGSCSFIPDYSTQEYRPPTAASPTPELDLDQPPTDVEGDNPGDNPEQSLEQENNLNLWQRFWRGLLGG